MRPPAIHPAAPDGSRETSPASRSPLEPAPLDFPSRHPRLLFAATVATIIAGAAVVDLTTRQSAAPFPVSTARETPPKPALEGRDPAAAAGPWTNADALAAFARAQTLPAEARADSVAELARILARRPADALAIGRALLERDPSGAADDVAPLLGELIRAGAFSTAGQLADAAPDALRADWQLAALNAWLNARPDAAIDLASILAAHPLHGAAFQTLAGTWAATAPEQLAAHALTLPAGPERSFALQTGVEAWIQRDASTAGAWLSQLGDTAEFEHALAALIVRTDTLNRPTATALEWAEGIDDPQLRLEALTHVLREWSATEHAGPRRYLAADGRLDAPTRARLTALLDPVREN